MMQSSFQVVCTSVKSNEVLIFDIGYVSSEPVEVSFHIIYYCTILLDFAYIHICWWLFSFENHIMILLLILDAPPLSVGMKFLLHFLLNPLPCS